MVVTAAMNSIVRSAHVIRHLDHELVAGKSCFIRCFSTGKVTSKAAPTPAMTKLPPPTVEQLRIVAYRAAIPVSFVDLRVFFRRMNFRN